MCVCCDPVISLQTIRSLYHSKMPFNRFCLVHLVRRFISLSMSACFLMVLRVNYELYHSCSVIVSGIIDYMTVDVLLLVAIVAYTVASVPAVKRTTGCGESLPSHTPNYVSVTTSSALEIDICQTSWSTYRPAP